MVFRPTSLQQRFTLFLIAPVVLLLVGLGFAVFFYARDMLLDQWREASILKLQRAAHEMDMHLSRIKDGIRLIHEGSGASYSEAYHQWALEHLSHQEGIQDVALTWVSGPARPAEPRPGHGGPVSGHHGRMLRFQTGMIREITPPVFDAGGQHGTVKMISELLDEQGGVIGRLEVTANFDHIFQGVVESGWWQSSKAFLVDRGGAVLICTVPGRHAPLAETDDPLENAVYRTMQSAPSGTVMGAGHPPGEVGGFVHLHEAPWVLVMIAPGEEVLEPIIRFRWGFSLFVLLNIAVIAALIRLVTARTVAEIRRVSDEALRLSRGEFGDPLPVVGQDEVSELTRSFNRMTRQLRERLALKRDLGLAMEVQQNLLPSGPPTIPGLDIAGRSVYCQETGGDYYDYIPLADSGGRPRLCAAVGDVVGHGIPAALLMTTVRALLRGRLDRPGGLAEKVCDINRLLCLDTAASGSFATLFLIEVDPGAGRLEWVRAGHDPALLYRAGTDSWEELGGSGMALGVEGACTYPADNRAGFERGDIVLVGTDGIWETQNPNGERFGKGRAADAVRTHRDQSAERILQEVLNVLDRFRGRAAQEDDVTLVVIKAGDAP
jgi:sigma-B regulation protein RsbU (phosphoserine phosphatase)